MAEYQETLFQEITEHKKRAFLAAYAHTGRITHAAKAAQVNWRNHYNWLKQDESYAEAFEIAKSMAGDWLEDEAIRRAKEGLYKPIYYQGRHVDDVLEFSDTLLIFLLKGAKPDRYKERHEHTGVNNGPIQIQEHEFDYGAARTEIKTGSNGHRRSSGKGKVSLDGA